MTPTNNTIKTARHNKFLIMMILVALVSLAFIIWFSLNNEILVIKITVFVMCGVFLGLSIVMIMYLTLDYLIFDEEGRVISHKIFTKKRIKVKDIDYYQNKDGLVTLFYQGKVFGSFDSADPNYISMMKILENNKVKSR